MIRVSSNLLPLLGARPALGRLFEPSDDQGAPAARVAILHHGTWMRRFGGDPGVVGTIDRPQRPPYQIVGVMPGRSRCRAR